MYWGHQNISIKITECVITKENDHYDKSMANAWKLGPFFNDLSNTTSFSCFSHLYFLQEIQARKNLNTILPSEPQQARFLNTVKSPWPNGLGAGLLIHRPFVQNH